MSERWYPKDKDDLMLAIDRERTAFWNLVRGLSEAQMSMPDSSGWAPKDNVAHLSAWMRSLRRRHGMKSLVACNWRRICFES